MNTHKHKHIYKQTHTHTHINTLTSKRVLCAHTYKLFVYFSVLKTEIVSNTHTHTHAPTDIHTYTHLDIAGAPTHTTTAKRTIPQSAASQRELSQKRRTMQCIICTYALSLIIKKPTHTHTYIHTHTHIQRNTYKHMYTHTHA